MQSKLWKLQSLKLQMFRNLKLTTVNIRGLQTVVKIYVKAVKIEDGTESEKLWELTAMQIEVVKMKA